MSAPAGSSERQGSVGAVVVSHAPHPLTLRRVLDAVAPQVAHVFLVDNASDTDPLTALGPEVPTNLSIVKLPENLGIAAAQNSGIDRIRRRGMEFVLLLDDDSVCSPGMVDRLVRTARGAMGRGVQVAAVGPQYRAGAGEPLSGFVRFGSFGFRRHFCPPTGEEAVEADFLISSGTLLPVAVLERVGGMEEGLFIDHVDTEWFLRARDHGFRCLGVCSAVMEHQLGEGTGRLWLGRWRRVPHHRPFRYYYIVRNSVLLYRRSYAPARWIIGDLLRLVAIGVFNLTTRSERTERLRMMALGLRDGIAGENGPLTTPRLE